MVHIKKPTEALKRLLAEDSITLDRVCTRTGLSKQTLYRILSNQPVSKSSEMKLIRYYMAYLEHPIARKR